MDSYNKTAKRTDETQLQYIKRLTENRKEYNLEYSEWANLITDGYVCSNDNARKSFYTVSAMLETIDVVAMEAVKAEDVYKEAYIELEAKRRELYKERVRLQDVNREINARLRWESRWEDLANHLIETIKNQNHLPLIMRGEEHGSGVEASILLSDWHIGLGINTPHNTFNIEEARKRVGLLAEEVIRVCKASNVDVLNIDMLGDMVSGTIHTTTRIYQVCDVIEQTSNTIELICQFINAVSPHFAELRLHSVAGNHDRVTASYKESLQEENWIRIIDMVIELRTGLKFERSGVDQEIDTYQLRNGRVVGLQHGHNFKGKLEDGVKDVTHYLRDNTNCDGIDYMHMGHFHSFRFANGTIVNGCLSGSDQYANKARFNDSASQVLVLYHDNGNQTLHNIILN